MDAVLETLKLIATQYALKVLGVIILVIVAFWVARRVKQLIVRIAEKRSMDVTVGRFLGTLARWLVVTLAFIAALGVFGVETTSFAAILGAAGLAIGLALQGSLSHLAAGVMLLIFRPFKVGDYVEIAGDGGTVESITLFTTALDTLDNRRIIVPNGKVFGAVIENRTFHDIRRVDVNVGVAYGDDMQRTREILGRALAGVPGRIAEPASAAVLINLGGSSVDWQLRVWCKTEDYWAVREATTQAAKAALDEAGLSIPFPQVDVHMDRAA